MILCHLTIDSKPAFGQNIFNCKLSSIALDPFKNGTEPRQEKQVIINDKSLLDFFIDNNNQGMYMSAIVELEYDMLMLKYILTNWDQDNSIYTKQLLIERIET